MVRFLRSPALAIEQFGLMRPIVWGSLVYVVAVLFFAQSFVRDASIRSVVVLSLVALAPFALFAAFRSPLIFPYCAYIIVLPFDSLSSLASGGTLARLLGLFSAVVIAVRLLRRGGAIKPPRAVIAWTALLLWMSASLFWALDADFARGTFQTYVSLVLLFGLLAVVKVKPREFAAVLAAIVVAGIISAGYVAYLYHSGQGLVTANQGVSRVLISVGDSQIDPNALAAALVLPTAIVIFWLFNSRSPLVTIVMLPALAILLLGFAASGSRGGFIELGIVFAYLIVRSRHRLWLAALMFVAAATTLIANPGLPARFADAQQDGGAGRSDIWHIGIRAFGDYWLFGAGVGNFPLAFNREYLNVYVRYPLGWNWTAHNVPLLVATELGVVGFVIFIIALTLQFRMFRGVPIKNAHDFELRLVLQGALLGIIVSGFSTSDLNAKYVWLAFSLMALYRCYLLSSKQPNSTAKKPTTTIPAGVEAVPIQV